MGVELKPCPHCGMAVTLVDRDKLFVFRCPDESPCIGVGFATYGKRDQRETAITAWNTRATDTELADLRRKLDVARETSANLIRAAEPLRKWVEKDLRNERSKVAAMEQLSTPVEDAIRKFDAAIAALRALAEQQGE